MIGVKKNVIVFFGLFLIGMLFVPTGIPFMDPIPEAEATHATAGSMIETSISSEYTISDDATGGDCTTIGTWNSGTKTCTLTGNLTVDSKHGIEIHSDGITLDGGGYTLTGTGYVSDQEEVGLGTAGIWVYQRSDFTIKNFDVDGTFAHAVRTAGTYDGVITEITSTGTYRIYSKSDDGLQILNNVLGGAGTSTGITVWNGDGNQNCSGSGAFVIKGNTVGPGFQNTGIKDVIGDGVCIDGNTVTGNGSGIAISSSVGSVVTNNISNNNGHGIGVGNSSVLVMTGNTANSNTYNGFDVDGISTVVTFTGNTATGNGTVDFNGITQESGAPSGTVSASSISIGQSGTTNGGDCETVGTWQPQPNSSFPHGGICTLTADIQITGTGAGITIASSSVTLDGAGRTITGNAPAGVGCCAYQDHKGVAIGTYHTSVVKNLTITDFYRGISGSFANGLTITGVTISDAGPYAIYLYGTEGLTLESNNISGFVNIVGHNAALGQGNGSCVGNGQYVSSSTDGPMVIKSNTITGGGLSIEGIGYCVDGNTISGGTTGLNIYAASSLPAGTPTNHIISNNVIGASGNSGMSISSSGNTITGNTLDGGDSTYKGFVFGSVQNNVITNNVANNYTQYGFWFSDGDGSIANTFTGNTASGNGIADFLGTGPPSGTVTTNIIVLNASTGGECSLIGTWTASTRTCTLTADVNITPAGEGGFAITSVTPSSEGDVGIILDGDGHTITGAGITGESFGVRITGQSEHVLIRDLTIKNFQFGIKSDETDGLSITGVTVDSVGTAMHIEGDPTQYYGHPSPVAYPVAITYSTVKNSDTGIRLFDMTCINYLTHGGTWTPPKSCSMDYVTTTMSPDPSFLWLHNTVIVAKNTVQNIGNTGIGFSNSDGAVAYDNTIEDSTNSIAVTNQSHYVRIENNVITDSTSAAIYLQGAERIHIKGNTITGEGEHGGLIRDEQNSHNFQIYDNSFQGMKCNNSDNGRIVGNTISNYDYNGAAGIFFAYCDHLVVSDNMITNIDIGIQTFSSGPAASVNGTFTSNTITNNDWYGIFIAGSDHVISDNIVNNNGVASSKPNPSGGIIIIGGSNFTVTGNTANNNDQCGIYANSGHTVSDNTATGNVQDDLCGAIAPIYPPTVTVPADITVAAPTPSGTTVTYSGVTATDNVSVASGPTCDIASGTNFAVGTTTITCSATDNAGNVGSATFTVTVTYTDVILPIITVPDNISSSSISESGMVITYTNTTATDNVAVTTGPTCDPTSGSTFPIGTTTVTCTASDAAGNTTTETFTVTLAYTPLDSEAPTITVPSTITLTTSNTAGTAATFSVSASDNVAVTTGPTCGVASGSNFAIGDTTVTCTASDAEGNTATETFTVTVQLASPPTVSIFSYGTLTSISNHVPTGVFSSPVYYPITASSSLGIASGPTCTPASNSVFSVGTTIVSCTATDNHGTVGTTTFNVVVSQQSALSDSACQAAASDLGNIQHEPNSVFVCEFPFNVTVEEDQRLVWVDTQPYTGFFRHSITSSTGLFDHSDAAVMDFLPSSWGGVGTYSFYDKLNPSLTGSITIAESDNTNPTVTVPSDMTISTESPTGTPTVTYSVSATDDREVTSGPTCNIASGTSFSVGTTAVTCTASDAAGNTGTSSFNVTVEYTFVDITEPGLVVPSDISLSTTNPSGTIVTYSGVTASDNVAVTSGPTCTPASGTMFPIGTTTVTCMASDAAGNNGAGSFSVTITQTIIDNTAPVITIPDNISQSTTVSTGKIVNYGAATAIDNIGVTSGPTCTPASGTLFSVGTTTVTCTASDGAGNTATASFTVTIINTEATGDTLAPQLTAVSNITKETNLSNGATVFYNLPTATDNVGVTYGPICTPLPGSLFSIGSTTVTCIAKDAAGNQGSTSFHVLVIPPVVTDVSTVTLQLDKSSYSTGELITVTGVADPSGPDDVLLNVIAPNGNLVSVNQITPGQAAVSQSFSTQATVLNSQGSSFEGCEVTNNCFLPNLVTIGAGGTVTWENPDSVPHTVTAGSPTGGPNGVFDSSLIAVNGSFSHKFNAVGTYSYFCQVHPWMQGSVIVQGSGSTAQSSTESGSYSTQIQSDTFWQQDGIYTVKVMYGTAEATKNFNFTVKSLDDIPFTSIPTGIEVSIDKSDYTGYETLSIDVELPEGSAGQPISIAVNDPVGESIFLQTLNTDSQGNVSTKFTLPEGVVSGTYMVTASSKGKLWDFTDSTAFTGYPIEPGILDSSVKATTEEGESVTLYNAGDLGYFSTKLTTKSTSPILVTVSILDAQQNTLGVGFFKTVFPKGDSEIVLGFDIPEGTISGDALVFTNFFTDWPDQGGVLLGDEIRSQVKIIGVEPVAEPEPIVMPESTNMQVTILNAPGSSTPGCEETNECFLPFVAEIDVGGTVTWENPDNVPHTATAGSVAEGPSGVFDSSLIMAGSSFSFTFDESGTYDYFCMVHPWMEGSIIVGGDTTPVEAVPELVEETVMELEPVMEPEPIIESPSEITSIQATVLNAPGSSYPGCEPNCFLPNLVTIGTGGTVTWENPDNVPHTATAGSVAEGPSGVFDSSLIMAGSSFSFTFDESGTYDYFCMVHPWMEGTVIVDESIAEPEPVIESPAATTGMEATVINAPRSSYVGCEETNECFLPSIVSIYAGGTVTWENPDSVPHTTTSRSSSEQGAVVGFVWDSGLIPIDSSFSHTFDKVGTYEYFCMIHPWMEGTVIVKEEPVLEFEPTLEESNIQIVDILALNGISTTLSLDGTNYLMKNIDILNKDTQKITISSWINPQFGNELKYSILSKKNTYDLFVTGYQEPQHTLGFSVYDGVAWTSLSSHSKLTDKWHHVATVVDGSETSIYLDGILETKKKLPVRYGFSTDGYGEIESFMSVSEDDVVVGAHVTTVSGVDNPESMFNGIVNDIIIITDALTVEQIIYLYEKDKEKYQSETIPKITQIVNGTLTTIPALTDTECLDLAKEMGYNENSSEPYTLVCGFPFDVVIPLNSRVFWVQVPPLENELYHTIRSVDNIVNTGMTISADMGFYEPTSTNAVYEFYDELNKSLTGKIIISTLGVLENPTIMTGAGEIENPIATNNVSISSGTASPGCELDYSCYVPFALSIGVGQKVTWKTSDVYYHTVTSGSPTDGPDGMFDSGLFGEGETFSYKFNEQGKYDYFCLVHPWMSGIIIVEGEDN